ncbi:MAG: DUF4406 domain-containing protein [Bacilli bacterium]
MIYIAGAITNVDNYLAVFNQAEFKLKASGYDKVYNPAKVSFEMPTMEWQDYMDFCMLALSKCKTIYMLKGWEKSKGATIEHDYAVKHCLEIIYEVGV